MNNIMPSLEVKARRVGGATYQVPIEVRPERRQTLGLRWLTLFARKRLSLIHISVVSLSSLPTVKRPRPRYSSGSSSRTVGRLLSSFAHT